MEITIFKEVTTEGVITSIEENSKKYHDGLYANMNNLPERTMVKKGAAEIGDIIKQLKASRIKITKANTAAVNKEHDAIVARLQVANKPFTDLLDAYNVERKKELDIEKARKQAIEYRVKFEADHEFALLLNKTFEYDREQELKERAEIKKEMQRNAQEEARAYQEAKNKEEAQHKINEESARLANKEHCAKVNNEVLNALVKRFNFNHTIAKELVVFIAKNNVPNLTINY
jgi:hypothetical protein